MSSARERRAVLLDCGRAVLPFDTRQSDDQPVVEFPELGRLRVDNVRNLGTILEWECHPQVAIVREGRDALVELTFVKGFRKRQKRGAYCRSQVDLLRQPHTGVILDDSKWLVHPACDIERVPGEQVCA